MVKLDKNDYTINMIGSSDSWIIEIAPRKFCVCCFRNESKLSQLQIRCMIKHDFIFCYRKQEGFILSVSRLPLFEQHFTKA
jgi:hypothetical protein